MAAPIQGGVSSRWMRAEEVSEQLRRPRWWKEELEERTSNERCGEAPSGPHEKKAQRPAEY